MKYHAIVVTNESEVMEVFLAQENVATNCFKKVQEATEKLGLKAVHIDDLLVLKAEDQLKRTAVFEWLYNYEHN